MSMETAIGNCEGPMLHYKKLKDAMKYSEKLMRSIYQVCGATNYIDCQIDCYKAMVTSFKLVPRCSWCDVGL